MRNVRKIFLTSGFVVLAGSGLFSINALFTATTAMAMPLSMGNSDDVRMQSEEG